MERKRGTTVAVVAALIIAVVSLGVAFAAFSTTLTINGTATVEATNWDIHFSTTQNGDAPTSPGAELTATPTNLNGYTATSSGTGTLTATDFTWSGTFKTPGDKIQFSFYAVNAGDYNATLSGTYTSTVTCKVNKSTIATCPITYTVTTDAAGQTPFSNGMSLNSNNSQIVYVTASLDPNYGGTTGEGLDQEIEVETTQISLIYTQSGSAVSN